jgi:protein-S-isoprenylcysteine O-methyltransferase
MNMTPLPLVIPYAIAFWAAYVWAFYMSEWKMIRISKTTAPSTDAPPQDSLRWLGGLALVAQLLAFAVAFWPAAKFPISAIKSMFWLGLIVLIAGSMLRRHCIRMLGESFTIDVRASSDQPIVERGAYAVVRHPAYTAAILMFVAVGLALGSYISLLILSATALFVYLRRISFEESALEAALGEKYRRYAARRKRLIPYIY